MERFKDKVAIITGAAHGLGANHALAFAREGADVVVSDICQDIEDATYGMGSQDEVSGVIQKIQDMGRRAIGVKCDVSKADEVEAMVQRAIDEFGKIDILVNNAGIAFVATPIWEVTESIWDLTMNVMLKGTFLCTKAVLPHMIKQKSGKIVNVSSIAAKGNRYNVPYSAVKAGIEIFTLGTAKDVGEHKINVNCVAPGSVRTPMVNGALNDISKGMDASPDDIYQEVVKQMQILGNGISMDDITNGVLFLCSEEARNVNGHTLYVDGGLLHLDME